MAVAPGWMAASLRTGAFAALIQVKRRAPFLPWNGADQYAAVSAGYNGRVSSPVLNLNELRRGCAHCSLQQLCLPAGIGAAALADVEQVDLMDVTSGRARGIAVSRR